MREHLTLNLCERAADRNTGENMRTVTKAELKRERKGVCDDGGGSLLAEPKESCGARRDTKGLLPPPPGGCAGWSGRESDDTVRQIRNHPGGRARPRKNGGVITNASGLQLIQAADVHPTVADRVQKMCF